MTGNDRAHAAGLVQGRRRKAADVPVRGTDAPAPAIAKKGLVQDEEVVQGRETEGASQSQGRVSTSLRRARRASAPARRGILKKKSSGTTTLKRPVSRTAMARAQSIWKYQTRPDILNNRLLNMFLTFILASKVILCCSRDLWRCWLSKVSW